MHGYFGSPDRVNAFFRWLQTSMIIGIITQESGSFPDSMRDFFESHFKKQSSKPEDPLPGIMASLNIAITKQIAIEVEEKKSFLMIIIVLQNSCQNYLFQNHENYFSSATKFPNI